MEPNMNKKKILVGGGAICAVAAIVTMARRARSEIQNPKWDKMRQHMEEMPKDFPPRVMYDNIEATRADTEEILELLRTGNG